MRDLEPLLAKLGRPRREAEVRERPAPALRGPVRAVRRLAGSDEVRQRRPVVAAARAGELRRVARSPAARVVDLELDLARALGRRARVDRAPDEHAANPVAEAVRDERIALAVHGDLDTGGIASDQLGGGGGAGNRERRAENGDQSRKPMHLQKLGAIARLPYPSKVVSSASEPCGCAGVSCIGAALDDVG